jgi:hypothetical protein
MNTSCPDTTVENLETALQPFPEPSFLTDTIERDGAGNMTQDQFNKLIANELSAGRLLEQNSFSVYQLGSRLNREFCYYLKRVVFFDKKYASSGNNSMKANSDIMMQKMNDMLASINFTEVLMQSGNQTTPTESRPPASWNALGLTENFTAQRIEGMSNPSNLALRKDMLSYSEEKNRAATSLLALYGFLNLTAVGLLIYIYRSK